MTDEEKARKISDKIIDQLEEQGISKPVCLGAAGAFLMHYLIDMKISNDHLLDLLARLAEGVILSISSASSARELNLE